MKGKFLNKYHRQWPERFGVLSLLIFLCLAVTPAYAHKVHLFAYSDGDLIKTEGRFNGGRPAKKCEVTVRSSSMKGIAVSGKSDDKGFYQFPKVNLTGDLDIFITCGDGHKGSWHLAESEYRVEAEEKAGHVHTEGQSSLIRDQDTNEDMLRHIIAEEVEKKVAPLRRELARLSEDQVSLQDILGGIGYLLGLAGLAAYMKYKKAK